MKRVFRATMVLFGLFLLLDTSAAGAASQKVRFLVLPFAVQGSQSYAYLERSVPQMLNSRLYWKDRVEPALHDLPASVKPVSSQEEAEKLRARYKADYVIWGDVTVVGDDASIDARVADRTGKVWPQARQTRASLLMNAVKGVSDDINADVFGRAATPASATARQGSVNQMNPDIMINQTSSREVYLNPQFRYAGPSSADNERLRSQALAFSAIGMEVVDADSDGRDEIFLLDDRMVRAFTFADGQLSPKGEFKFPITSQCLSIRSMSHPSGKAWIIVTAVDSRGKPISSILTYSGGNFTQEMKDIKYYLNVVKMPPTFRPILIGQEAQPPRLFKPGIHEMVRQGGTLVPSKRIAMPSDVNVFNFTYLPAGRDERDGDKLIVLTTNEHLRVYTSKGARVSESADTFSGSAVGLEIDPTMPGLGKETVTMASVFYVPMRMLAMDLERDGVSELLVNKPISTASEIFDRYRFFPQGEIHSLFWDGLGLNLQWKTRRIKGSTVDYAIADPDNNGIPDLVVCLNTHPGALGVKARKTIVTVYPLDISRTDPNTRVDKSDVYDGR